MKFVKKTAGDYEVWTDSGVALCGRVTRLIGGGWRAYRPEGAGFAPVAAAGAPGIPRWFRTRWLAGSMLERETLDNLRSLPWNPTDPGMDLTDEEFDAFMAAISG